MDRWKHEWVALIVMMMATLTAMVMMMMMMMMMVLTSHCRPHGVRGTKAEDELLEGQKQGGHQLVGLCE